MLRDVADGEVEHGQAYEVEYPLSEEVLGEKCTQSKMHNYHVIRGRELARHRGEVITDIFNRIPYSLRLGVLSGRGVKPLDDRRRCRSAVCVDDVLYGHVIPCSNTGANSTGYRVVEKRHIASAYWASGMVHSRCSLGQHLCCVCRYCLGHIQAGIAHLRRR